MANGSSCNFCGGRVIYRREYSGESLCYSCFRNSLVEKVRKNSSTYSMFGHGERIAVAVSGGKDSLSLLKILSEICIPHGSELVAITVDEGIQGYRDEAIEFARDFCSKLGVEQRCASFGDLFGFPLDEALKLRRSWKISSCSLCGTWRRRALERLGEDVGADVVATAHNLDDILQTFMINLLSGDLARLRGVVPVTTRSPEFSATRVKPFFSIYEKEIALFAHMEGIPVQSYTCPYMDEGMRSEVRAMLNQLESRHPGIKLTFLKTALQVADGLVHEEHASGRCTQCGLASSSPICSACSIRRRLLDVKASTV